MFVGSTLIVLYYLQVVNVDDDGNKISVGHLEVTDTELILRQKHKPATVWPLKSLRRYGADSELFSFESGRRAPTGTFLTF